MIGRRFADLLARLKQGGRSEDSVRLAAILELNRELARAEDRQQLLTLLLDRAVRLFGAERGFVVLAPSGDADERLPKVSVARSLDAEPIRRPETKISTSIVGQCVGTRGPVFCEDAREGDFGAAQSVADLKLRSVVATPLLLAGDEVLGVIYLDHRFQSGAFCEEDLPWLQAFADQAAIAIHLHQLLEQNREYAAAMVRRAEQLEVRVAEQAKQLSALQSEWSRDRFHHRFDEIAGQSPALLKALHLLDRVVDAGELPVLLTGESGTGKELFARAIWSGGPRAGRPFRAVNVAALPEALLESELFGHAKGAFTGADRARAGLLREADGGVLFLDEITEMPVELQAKLLRFLEDRVVRPLGSDRIERVDLRIVAATNRDPSAAVADGHMRADLYYRLAAVTISLPPLRDRDGDVRLLADWFLAQAAEQRGGEARRLSDACLAELERRPWPGNVRQLRNEMLRLDALARATEIGPELLSEVPVSGEDAAQTLHLASLERWAIEQALERSGGNKAAAARMLGISRRALYNKLDRSGS